MEPLPDPPFPLSVLVVEDDPDTAQSQATILTLYGHAVRCVGTGPAAVRAATANPPDVILLDIRLPGLNGWEVARQLRAAGCPAVFIAVSACDGPDDFHRSREAGIHFHLVKPVDPAQLVGVLRRVARALGPASPSAGRR